MDKQLITLKQIQARLAEAIKNSGLTQSEIARCLKVSQSNISHYLKGDKMPALDTLANLCKIIDCDANYILCQN
ncbi:MAG: helix-turn-helix transcriptional regulator [Clostridia bacterium]|jgi:transcriptional regulator with XRE-family HTH domain|nr:helix-turn-helix transcriptional regulator [Clostridia bacterium]